MGAPGVGKGTFARLLSRDFKLPELSSGAELRRYTEREKGEIAEKIKKIRNEGGLVDSSFVLDLVKRRLETEEFKSGVILDGYPRSVEQIEMFLKYRKIDLSIKIEIDDNITVKKMTGRRECSKCLKNYNIFSFKENGYDMDPLLPKVENLCDDCGGNLIHRSDDNATTIKERLQVYNEKTIPMNNYFKTNGVPLVTFEPKRGVKDYPILKEIILKKLEKL
jgi:adenylate kinase